jgi:acyl-CoA dehydrogenase
MTGAGYLGALIPEEYGGMGLDLSAACAILEEVNRSGANAGPAHAQMYTMGTLLRHGSEEQRREYLPKIARGDLTLQAFAVTEPEAGTDYHLHSHDSDARGQSLRGERAQDLHLQG